MSTSDQKKTVSNAPFIYYKSIRYNQKQLEALDEHQLIDMVMYFCIRSKGKVPCKFGDHCQLFPSGLCDYGHMKENEIVTVGHTVPVSKRILKDMDKQALIRVLFMIGISYHTTRKNPSG